VAKKLKQKNDKAKVAKPKAKPNYDRTWEPEPTPAVSRVKIKTKAVPIPKVSLKGIKETKKPRTRQA
jgi:hypothetical protein